MFNYEKIYGSISDAIRKKEPLLKLFNVFYIALPCIVIASYGILLALTYFQSQRMILLRIIAVTFLSFVAVSVFRKAVNRKRPYVKYNTTPLIQKQKKGESFPSRHTFSAAIIAMAWYYTNIKIGMIMWGITLMIAILRFIGGVHYFSDVFAACILALVMGYAGFYLI